MTKHFDYEKFKIDFELKGKQMYGLEYSLSKTDETVLPKLLAYFDTNKEVAEKFGIKFQKGLLLTGSIGVGKTSIMRIFREFLHPQYRFIIKPCRDVAFEFIQNGADTIFNYSTRSYNDKRLPKVYCFDDLGLEPESNFYKNHANVMREIILSRYDLFISQKMITHFTTNFTATEILNKYGIEVRSRMREMCNIISFDSEIQDNRK